MKKLTLPLLASLFVFGTATAQDYNKWSVDLNGGFAKPARTLSSGYSAETFKNLHLDGGVRYSFNNKFGLKASFGYDKLDEWTNKSNFEANHYRTSLEGVVNLGRVLNFESWTSVFNVQAHAGGGYSWLKGDGFTGTDNMAHLMAGLTGQVKLHRRVALNADFTVIQNAQQNQNWDGVSATNRSVFQGTMFNATVGVSIYLGKHAQHADWYAEAKDNTIIEELSNKLTKIENDLKDSDNDGVADYLDLEPNTPANTLVDSKGRTIDTNNSGIADNIEKYIDEKYGDLNKPVSSDDAALIKDLINKGYVAAYFDFDKAQPSTVSGVNFIVNYLKNNPSASVEVIGYADATGNQQYNNKLSERRANAIKDIIVKSGVNASRVSTKGAGVDSASAKSLARKVVFKIK